MIQRVMQLMLCGTHQPPFKNAKTQRNMAVAQICAKGSQQKPQRIHAKNIPDLQMLAEAPDEQSCHEAQYTHSATVVNETLDGMGPKNSERRQRRRRVMDSMTAP